MSDLDRLVALQFSDPAKQKENTNQMLSMLLAPVSDLLANEEIEIDLNEIQSKIVDTVLPITQETAKEGYQKFFTPKQLKAYADFCEENPWIFDRNTQVATWVAQRTNELMAPKIQLLTQEFLKEHGLDFE
jgi:hypothetical protein